MKTMQVHLIIGTTLVHQPIGKHIHPTRDCQIVETESAARLSLGEQGIISRDQKHSSQVARSYYQNISSRNVVAKARQCMDKLKGQSQTGKGLTKDSRTATVVDCKQVMAKLECRVHDINHDQLFDTKRSAKEKSYYATKSNQTKSKCASITTEED